jgi:hypothetical protein
VNRAWKARYRYSSSAAAELGERRMRPGAAARELHLTPEEENVLRADYERSLEQVYGREKGEPLFEKLRSARTVADSATHSGVHRPGQKTGLFSGAGDTSELPSAGHDEENDGSGRGGNGGGGAAGRFRPNDRDEQDSLFDSGTSEEVAESAARDRDQLQGDRLTAQLAAPLTREEQLKN